MSLSRFPQRTENGFLGTKKGVSLLDVIGRFELERDTPLYSMSVGKRTLSENQDVAQPQYTNPG